MHSNFIIAIKSLRKEIRDADYNRRLFQICSQTYRDEVARNKRISSLLKRVDAYYNFKNVTDLVFVFDDLLAKTAATTQKKQQEIIMLILEKIASDFALTYYSESVETLKNKSKLTKGLISEENKQLNKIEEIVKNKNNPLLNNLPLSIIAVENLNVDYTDIEEIREISISMHLLLEVAYKNLCTVSDENFQQIKSGSPQSHLLFKVYKDIVELNPQFCAFANRLKAYTNNRDILIYLDGLESFLEKFIHNLYIDWSKNEKMKNTINHTNNTIKEIKLMSVYLKNKLEKIDREIKIRQGALDKLTSQLKDD